MTIKSNQVREIIEARLLLSDLLREAHLPPTDDVMQKAVSDIDDLRKKLPSITQVLVTDVVTLEMEALAKEIGFKGMSKMKRASRKLRDLALEYKAESYELASEIAELATALKEQSDVGLKEREKEAKKK